MARRSTSKVTEDALRAQLRSAHRRLADTETEVRALKAAGHRNELLDDFPQLAGLFDALTWAVLDADPIVSGTDEPHVTTSRGFPEPGAATRHGRRRLTRWGRRLDRLIADFNHEINGDPEPETPRCWNRKCQGYNIRQRHGQPNCGWCTRPLTINDRNDT